MSEKKCAVKINSLKLYAMLSKDKEHFNNFFIVWGLLLATAQSLSLDMVS